MGPAGERSFRYWRDGAPVAELFELPDWMRVAESLMAARLIYFSGITLSLLSNNSLGRLLAVLEVARQQGVKVAFDGNFRPRGWKGDLGRTRTVFIEALKRVDIALPTFDDEAVLWGDPSPETTVTRLQAFGIGEIVVKNGPNSALVATGAHAGIRAGAGGRGAGRHHGGRRRFQCRLSRGAAWRPGAGAGGERRASPRRQRDPPLRRAGAAHQRRDALKHPAGARLGEN